ncbi:MAG: Sec-independent protein translocase subunit TatA [Nostocoides sp.]
MGKGLFEGWHLIILAVVLIALFGAKRLPDAARSVGRSMRVFKSEVDEMKKDGKSAASSATVPGETVPDATDVPKADPVDSAIHENAPRTDNSSGPLS